MEGNALTHTPVLFQSDQHQPPAEPYQPYPQNEPTHEADSQRASVPATYSPTPQFSPEVIAALKAEERRIDAEMEEVHRMKELRDQKHAI